MDVMEMRIYGPGWQLDIQQEWVDVTSSSPTPNERWAFTDSNGHDHRYDHGYPTLELVVDETHWCDGNEGIWPHDPHEQVDASHYECRTCREVIEPALDPPFTSARRTPVDSAPSHYWVRDVGTLRYI